MSRFCVTPDRRCQRGLTFRYAVEGPCKDRLLAALDRSFEGRLVAGETQLGPLSVELRILQFRWAVEILGDGHEIIFRHRLTANATQRGLDRAWFEDVLGQLPAAEAA